VETSLAALQAYFPDGKFYRRVQPLPEYNCIYVRNAKVATSTIVFWLDRIHTGDYGFVPERNIHREHRLPQPGRDVPLQIVARMLSGDAFRFAFVRHPIPRVESAYLDKIADQEKLRFRAEVRAVLGRPSGPDAPMPFEEFIDALEAQPAIEMNPHWRPQHLNLMHPLVHYDMVGRLENFDSDLKRVQELASLPQVPLDLRNATNASRRVSLFDGKPDLRRRVARVYADDLELYGYR
jgi:Sulfotransferase family